MAVAVEDVGSVLVNQDSLLIVAIECVSADVRALVYDQDRLAILGRKALGKHTTGESRAGNHKIEHGCSVQITGAEVAQSDPPAAAISYLVIGVEYT